MKNKHFGFTLIELLVVIVIIGILATISTATFKSYFGKARDAERLSAVQNMALMVKVDGADQWGNDKFMHSEGTAADNEATTLKSVFDENDFRLPKGTNNICYLIAMSHNPASNIGDENEFAVVTWGESTSTKESGVMGPLVDGTSGFVDQITEVATIITDGSGSLTDGSLSGVDFECGKPFVEVIAEFAAATAAADGFTTYYLAIDEIANIVLIEGNVEYVEAVEGA